MLHHATLGSGRRGKPHFHVVPSRLLSANQLDRTSLQAVGYVLSSRVSLSDGK